MRQAADAAADTGSAAFGRSELLATLASGSGLPLGMLDAEVPLDLAHVRKFLSDRVIGQPEVVDCLVDRVAMAKAG